MKKSIKIISVIMSALIIVLAFSACSVKSDKQKTTLKMATNATFPPYEFIENGEISGIDVDIANAVAEKLGMKLEIEDTEFDSIVTGVQSGKYDMGMAGMSVTPERLKNVNFSTSYATGIQAIIVKEGSSIKGPDDLTGKKLGVQQGTTGWIYACEDFGDENVVAYKSGPDAVSALKTGKIDAVIIDNEPAKSYVAANTGLVVLEAKYAEEEYSIAVAKNNDELLKKINGALAEMKDDGSLDKIIAKYIKA